MIGTYPRSTHPAFTSYNTWISSDQYTFRTQKQTNNEVVYPYPSFHWKAGLGVHKLRAIKPLSNRWSVHTKTALRVCIIADLTQWRGRTGKLFYGILKNSEPGAQGCPSKICRQNIMVWSFGSAAAEYCHRRCLAPRKPISLPTSYSYHAGVWGGIHHPETRRCRWFKELFSVV